MIKGDKIKLIHKMGAFDNIGEICEVTDIQDGGVICFRFGNNGCHLGCMSYDEYVKYFEPITEEHTLETPKRKWSEWKATVSDQYYDLNSIAFKKKYWYRENDKKVQVKCDNPKLKAEASCHKEDSFNINKGLNLAEKRLVIKLLDWQAKEMARKM